MYAKEKRDYVKMYNALRTIAKEYRTYEQVRIKALTDHGLHFQEFIEMSYESIQLVAKKGLRGVSKP